MLGQHNIEFIEVANSQLPVLDLGTSVLLNLSNPEIAFVHGKLVNEKTNRMTAVACMAYCFMMAQRFDLAHDHVSRLVDFNRPPEISHGTFRWSDYDVTMHKAQRLYREGFYEDALNIVHKHGLQGPWADRLMKACSAQSGHKKPSV